MQEPQRLKPEEREIEQILAAYHPTSPLRVNAASILFEARRRRQRLQLWTWRSVAAVLAIAVLLQFSFTSRGHNPTEIVPPSPIVMIGIAPQPPASATPTIELPLTGDGYISTRNRELAFGVKPALPPASAASPPVVPPIQPVNAEPTIPSLFELLLTPDQVGKS